jgi:hypothetical protein
MSYAEQFVIQNNLQPADAILLKKKFMGMLDHFAVYVGRDMYTNQPLFAANYKEGVTILKEQEVNHFLSTLVPEKIERFQGTPQQRGQAVERAIKMIGKAAYHLILNNCEHYKNFVQFGKKYSAQVDVAGRVTAITGGVAVLAGLASKNPKITGWGLFLLALGAIAVNVADQDK